MGAMLPLLLNYLLVAPGEAADGRALRAARLRRGRVRRGLCL